MDNYIIDGCVKKRRIASDICKGKLTRNEVEKLLANEVIRDSFIGNEFNKKVSVDKWNTEYLNRLPNYAVAEAFNEDYLLYLVDVCEYVNSSTAVMDTVKKFAIKNRISILIVIYIIVIIGGIIYFFDLVSRKGGETKYGRK